MTSIPRRGSSLCLTQSLVGKSSALAREVRKIDRVKKRMVSGKENA